MSDLPDELAEEIGVLMKALGQHLNVGPFQVAAQKGLLRAELRGTLFVVPTTYGDHYLRFGNIPTALVRDAAYEVKKARARLDGKSGAAVEADAMAFAEKFLRATVMKDRD